VKSDKKIRQGSTIATKSQALALRYMSTIVEVVREPLLILDADLRVLSANPIFYNNFRVTPKKTEKKLLYELGNGQWNIRKLKQLLEEVLPGKKVVENYEVEHTFEKIGKKIMQLNARQIDAVQLIILAIEDITERKSFETKLANHAKRLEATVALRTKELTKQVQELQKLNKTMVGRELKMMELKKEIARLKKQIVNGKEKA